jgi:nicotinamide mononucleotide transporter
MDPLELAGVATGVVAVALTVAEKPLCWPIGIVNVALFAVVFARARLYADAGLQVVYLVLCAYGWWQWLHGGRGGGALAVGRVPRRVAAALAGGAAAFAVGLGTLLARATDASFPFLDSSLAAGSLAAQFLQARKWLENWTVWIAVDVVYVGLYLAKQLRATALLYLLFTGLAVAGHLSWRHSLARSASS